MTPDSVNAVFELVGACFTWRNAYQLQQDKYIRGAYWPAWFFFATWGMWNLWYYPTIQQRLSFWAGALLLTGNLVWCGLALKYRDSSPPGSEACRL